MTEWLIRLPYHRLPLHENQRLHWSKRNELTQQVKDDTQVLATAAKLPRGLGFADITLEWQPAADGRRRDDHNASPTLKAAVDGLVRYGLVPDDNALFVASRCVIVPAEPGQRVGQIRLRIRTLTGVVPDGGDWSGLLDAARADPLCMRNPTYRTLVDTAAARSSQLVAERTQLREALAGLFTELRNHDDSDPEHRTRVHRRLMKAQLVLRATETEVPN